MRSTFISHSKTNPWAKKSCFLCCLPIIAAWKKFVIAASFLPLHSSAATALPLIVYYFRRLANLPAFPRWHERHDVFRCGGKERAEPRSDAAFLIRVVSGGGGNLRVP